MIVTFSSKYELFEDHFRTFTPDSDQCQGNVQPFTQTVDARGHPRPQYTKVFFTREGQQMVHMPGPVIYLEVEPEIWDSDAKSGLL